MTTTVLANGARLGHGTPLGPLGSKWDPILARCLDADPSRRYRDTTEIARALGPSLTRRRVLIAAAAVLLATITGVVTYLRATAPPETVKLAILPVKFDRGSSPEAEQISRELSNLAARLLGTAQLGLRFVSKPGAATHVLQASLTPTGDMFSLSARLTDVRSQVNVDEWKADYRTDELKYAPIALAGVITNALHLPPLDATAQVDEAARRDYQQGLTFVRHDSRIDEAIAAMERAVAADPDSALTHAGLAEATRRKYLLTGDESWLQRASHSIRKAEVRNPDCAAVHRIAGLFASLDERHEQAIGHYLRAAELDPANADSYLRIGETYERTNQLNEALAAYRKAIEVEPSYYRTHHALGAFHSNHANYGEAVAAYLLALKLAPEEPDLHVDLASAYKNQGRFADAEKELRLAIGLKKTAVSLHALGHVLMYQNREREAIPFFQQALEMNRARYLSWMYLGVCYRRTNRPADARAAFLRGVQTAEEEIGRFPRSGYVRSFLAYLCAQAGDKRRAEAETRQALQLSPADVDVIWMAALTYEAVGRRDSALKVLSRASREMLADLRRWPDVADLSRDSRFIQLERVHGK